MNSTKIRLKVLVPSRGFGRETTRQNFVVQNIVQVLVPSRGFGRETYDHDQEKGSPQIVLVPSRGFGRETEAFTRSRCHTEYRSFSPLAGIWAGNTR